MNYNSVPIENNNLINRLPKIELQQNNKNWGEIINWRVNIRYRQNLNFNNS